MGAGGGLTANPEPRGSSLPPPEGISSPAVQKDPEKNLEATLDEPKNNSPQNSLYLSAVAIVAIIAVVIISTWDSANSSAVIGLMNLATGAVGGMAGVALQKRS